MASVLIKDTRRSKLLLDSSTDDSHDVTLVCSDGSLKFGSHRLLGMWSPALRSEVVGEPMLVILPDFLKSTVTGVLEVVCMKWEDEMGITLEEKNLLDSLGISTGILDGMKQSFVQEQHSEARINNVSAEETKLKTEKSQKMKDCSTSEFYMCDLCDERVSISDLKSHLDSEHQNDLDSLSETEVQNFFRPYSEVAVGVSVPNKKLPPPKLTEPIVKIKSMVWQ